MLLEKLNVGVVGAVSRGASFQAALEAQPQVRIHAVCDVREELLAAARERLGATEAYSDYTTMLDCSDLDAVIIGSPMQFHTPQAIAALERNLHVLSEVTAGVSVDECRALVSAAARSKAIYMMAENYTYIKSNVLVRELARRGFFGEVYYAEGEYIHELKELNEITRWRRRWQTGIDGITYGTHSLGPILQWMPGDRVARVSCAGSGHHYRDPRGDLYENEDSCVMLAKTMHGALIKIRVDMLSDRPHAMANYQLQGTGGCYESGRTEGERHRIWLAALSEERNRWQDLECLEEAYMPEIWRHPPEAALRAGHGGGDYFEVLDFLRSMLEGAPCPIGIHEAMDMTLPGLMSQASIAAGGAWMEVPDSRSWPEATGAVPTVAREQLQMIWPEGRPAPTAPVLPSEYELRTFQPGDETGYLNVMHQAGFTTFDEVALQYWFTRVLPDGLFVVVHKPSAEIVATAMSNHRPETLHPFGAELGWVAASPRHAGKGLGRAVCCAVLTRLISAGYRRIFLHTDDWRLPALNIYLLLGFRPFLFAPDMPARWREVSDKLRVPFTPEAWPKA